MHAVSSWDKIVDSLGPRREAWGWGDRGVTVLLLTGDQMKWSLINIGGNI